MKDILGYEGLYKINEKGEIYSIPRKGTINNIRKISQRKNKYGYMQVVLMKNNKMKTFLVHRLVAQAFIPNPDNLSQVNRKDENKQNNCVDNLEFCDATYNNTYGTRLERASKACQKSVVQLDKNNNFIKEFSSITQVGNDLNISLGNVSNCCRGKVNFVGGYRWMYLEDYLNNIKKVS
jgi:hypothetical protein